MGSLGRRKSFLIGAFIAILALIIACGEEATPTAAPSVSAEDIQSIVSEAVGSMATPAPGGPSAAEITTMVTQAVQGASTEGLSPDQIQSMIESALASIEPGISAEEVAAVVDNAVMSAVAAATPAAMPAETPGPGMGMMSSGTLDFGVGDIGAEVYVIANEAYQATVYNGRVTHEHMFGSDLDGNVTPRLVASFEDTDNADGTWSRVFNLQQGAQWHDRYGDWGEFNADDFMFTMENVATEGSVHTNSGRIRGLFACDGCSVEKIDEYTVKLTRPEPTFQIEWWNVMPSGNTTLRSSRHYEAVGEEMASQQSVGTGPFQLMESLADDFKRAEAVQDHWRKTPEFAEFIWHQLAEESTRLANYLTGQIDTGQFSTDSIEAIKGEARDEDDYLVFPGARLRYIHVHAQNYYPDHPSHESEFPLGEGAVYTESCKTQAWVSCDRDTSSDEWARALKVRQVLARSIDRQKMINSLAFGEGEPAYTFGFMGHSARARQYGLDQLTWDYMEEAEARQALTDAGYPNGFEIEMHLTNTGGAGVDTSGEVISGMWRAVGIHAKHTVQPYSSFRPTILARTARGVRPDEQGVANEPLRYYSTFYVADNVFNFGIEHPELQDLIDEANVTYDVEERWVKAAEIGKWLHNNIVTIPLYEESASWPLGPEIGEWGVSPLHIEWLNNWEYVPHR